nr:immunoglobulin heavy chain junction region [Macaca mulatta]MOY22638.1 immunoglobulin heavy chain junction region [Macaca mulatta]MOY24142.1 immunoglobulin heavy chain junction region [Macaca mulatta]MOY24767.1 immunoglobulin heavy chain junction region [Macaca mulatta]MOY25557.1 immunoglobulin heavy chain junction region [Macaca mulatta]
CARDIAAAPLGVW